MHYGIPVWLIPSSPECANDAVEAWHYAVQMVLSPQRNIDPTGAELKWDYVDG